MTGQDLYTFKFLSTDGFDMNNPRVSNFEEEPDTTYSEFRYKVASVLQEIQDLLVEKNEAYGNSALDPINVFSKASSIEQLKVRIDDKLNRLYHGKEYGQEDTVTDLIGYLVLLKIAEKEQGDE